TLKKVLGNGGIFDGVHVILGHQDIPDDSALRLVALPPDLGHSRERGQQAEQAAVEYIKNNGWKPRGRGDRPVCLAADMPVLPRLQEAARVALAWRSIVDDVDEGRLNIDLLQKKQAQKELKAAEEVLPRVARECYKWLLCPVQDMPTDPKPTV